MGDINATLITIDYLTGTVAAFLLLGVFFGFIRAAVDDDSGPRLRSLSVFVCIMTLASLIECARVRDLSAWSNGWLVFGRSLGIGYNVLMCLACRAALQFLYYMIPAEIDGTPVRRHWAWYSAPLYPPWGFPTNWRDFVNQVTGYLRR